MQPIRLTIFHTNDMHGRLEAMARLSAFARRLRADAEAQGRRVFFWDAGDAEDRRVRLCSVSKGAAFTPILNAMGYTLAAMGNSISLTYGPQAMGALAERATFPILTANCRDGSGPLPEGLHAEMEIPLSDRVTLGVVGLTAPWNDAYSVFGLHFPDFRDVAREWVGRFRGRGVAPVIVLSHLGLEDDRRLVEDVPGIDLIVGAHSHHRLPTGEEWKGVLIAQSGEYAQALGRVDLDVDPTTGRVLARSAQVLDVPPDEPPDPAVMAAIAAAEQEVDALLARPVGVLETSLDLDHFQECGIGNLTTDALRERMGAQVAILCSGLFHEGLPAGTITLGQLDAACFSTANPALTRVRGAQILAALERGLDPSISQTMHHSFRGAPIGTLQISGMVVEYNPDASLGRRVARVWVGDEPLYPDQLYLVAHTDAEVMTSLSYLELDEGQKPEYEVPTIVREVIEDYLQHHSPLPRPLAGRWRPV